MGHAKNLRSSLWAGTTAATTIGGDVQTRALEQRHTAKNISGTWVGLSKLACKEERAKALRLFMPIAHPGVPNPSETPIHGKHRRRPGLKAECCLCQLRLGGTVRLPVSGCVEFYG